MESAPSVAITLRLVNGILSSDIVIALTTEDVTTLCKSSYKGTEYKLYSYLYLYSHYVYSNQLPEDPWNRTLKNRI